MRAVCVLLCLSLLALSLKPALSADQEELLRRFKGEPTKKGFWDRYGEKIERIFLISAMVTASILIPLLSGESDEYSVEIRWSAPYREPEKPGPICPFWPWGFLYCPDP